MAKSKKTKTNSKVLENKVNENLESGGSEDFSTLYYFYSVGCAFCKQTEPIVDELNNEGNDILKLDTIEPENKQLYEKLKKDNNIQCGTPFFIDGSTGKHICGYREKDVIEKWLDGEDIPTPPRPTGPMPRPPFLGSTGKEEADWKKEYKKWTEENSQLPNLQTAEQILSRPRPKSEPPRPPMGQGITDKQYKDWGKEWDKWKKDNKHLPNLQSSDELINNFKQRNQMQVQPQTPASGVDNTKINNIETKVNNIEARLQAVETNVTNLESKIDKIIKHFGVK
tara:strand:+ start:2035 stop:2880 length:846 start_codon:yes stop_codon:yes gene_type:complete